MNSNNAATIPWRIHETVEFKPLGTNILLLVEDTERKTPGGLYLPERDREAALIAKVVSVGSDVTIQVVPGDCVVFERYAGTAIRSTAKPAVLLLDQRDIMAKFERDPGSYCTYAEGCMNCHLEIGRLRAHIGIPELYTLDQFLAEKK